jgi:hypothetical protein
LTSIDSEARKQQQRSGLVEHVKGIIAGRSLAVALSRFDRFYAQADDASVAS